MPGTPSSSARNGLPRTPRGAIAAVAATETTGSTPQLRQSCQLQLAQLANQLPLVIAWLVYYTPERDRCELQLLCTDVPPEMDAALLADLKAETWLTPDLPAHQLSRLPLADHWVYVYPLAAVQLGVDAAPYLLVWSRTPLTEAQQTLVAQQAELLQTWLKLDQEMARYRSEIQILEQILQRAEHQLRNPLALISLYAENLRLALTDATLCDQASLIRDTVGDLSDHLAELLCCGRRGGMRPERLDLRGLLLESARRSQPWIDAKQLTVRCPEHPLLLWIDGWQIRQVLSNLLDNAIHFSPPGGMVEWRWRLWPKEVLVELLDQGPGLSPEDFEQVFTPFYSRRPKGTGLGLAIAKKIILDHRGHLWVQNRPDGGAKFSFTLPRH